MSEFSYQLGFSVNKPLPPISDPLVDVDFCSSTGAAQTPPTLRFQVSANATSDVEGVFTDCKSIGVGTGPDATTIVMLRHLALTPWLHTVSSQRQAATQTPFRQFMASRDQQDCPSARSGQLAVFFCACLQVLAMRQLLQTPPLHALFK